VRRSWEVPEIAQSEITPIVSQLLDLIRDIKADNQRLYDEIAKLKGHKPKPAIRPSEMEQATGPGRSTDESGKRPGSAKRKKTRYLEIHVTEIIAPAHVPEGSRFKGYTDFVVQDLLIRSQNTVYRLERWQLPDGSYVAGRLPSNLDGHFGNALKSYILYQYHQCRVTEPLILESLREFGVDISAGQLSKILLEDKSDLHTEKDEILQAGLEVSNYINVDDTGARHDGKNGFCTHIGNELFGWFKSTESKSRLNFIELLCSGKESYEVTAEALEYMRAHGIKRAPLLLELPYVTKLFEDRAEWFEHLRLLGINDERSIQVATEGLLVAHLLKEGIGKGLVVVSDDAGQFNLFAHALCWIHAERTIHKLIPNTDAERIELAAARERIWIFYKKLKKYKELPGVREKRSLWEEFDLVFKSKSCYPALNEAMLKLFKNKAELLLVLDRPEIPLHNNASETDIREYVQRRKISGGTRSDPGRQARDTFTSLKKTCRKLGVSFWALLNDRVANAQAIPKMAALIRQKAREIRPPAYSTPLASTF
jgi:hypothetical protein